MDVRTLYTQAKQAAPEEVLHQWQDIMEQFLQRRQERFVRMKPERTGRASDFGSQSPGKGGIVFL